MSTTPRTDAQHGPIVENYGKMVPASFARELEEEVNDLRTLLAEQQVAYEQNAQQAVALNRELSRVTGDAKAAREMADRYADQLARVTAERDNARAQALADRAFQSDNAALRARVAEQYAKGYDDKKREAEEEAVALRAQIENWKSGCDHQRNRAEQAEQRNAELETALRGALTDDSTLGHISRDTKDQSWALLARAEPATLAKQEDNR